MGKRRQGNRVGNREARAKRKHRETGEAGQVVTEDSELLTL